MRFQKLNWRSSRRRLLLSVAFALSSVITAANSSEEPAVRIQPLKPLPSVQLHDFRTALPTTPGGREFLQESAENDPGAGGRRIDEWQEQGAIPPGALLKLVTDDQRFPELRALALRTLNDDHEGLDLATLAGLLKAESEILRLEAVRTLQAWKDPNAAALLRETAADTKAEPELRAEAVAGLALAAASDKTARDLLLQFAAGNDHRLRNESLRSLRGLAGTSTDVRRVLATLAKRVESPQLPAAERRELAEQILLAYGDDERKQQSPQLLKLAAAARPSGSRIWTDVVIEGGDAAAGRRVFFHAKAAHCSQCHIVDGRGGHLASDLSHAGRAMDRASLIEAITEPSRQIPTPYLTWTVATDQGKTYTGLLHADHSEGIQLATAEGTLVDVPGSLIDHRQPQKVSLMPDKLAERMTTEEFRNLVAFLAGRK